MSEVFWALNWIFKIFIKLESIYYIVVQYRVQYRQIMFMIWSSLYSVCKFTQMGHKREKVFHFVFENRPNCKTWSAVSCILCKQAQSKTFYICLGPFLLHQIFFLVENKKNAFMFGNFQEKLNKLLFFWIFWEETAKMVRYFLGQEDLTNSNYDVISIINQSCHLTICLADWVAISLTSDFLLKERVDHMKKWLSWENFLTLDWPSESTESIQK